MNRFEKIINFWMDENTVPYNKPIQLNTIRTYTQNDKSIEHFNCLTHCKFIEYNNERRIIIPRDSGDSHYFTIPEFDGNHIEYETCFDKLILKLFSYIYRPGEGILDDTIMVNIQDVQDTLKYFNIDYTFDIDEDNYRVENGFYKYEGDDWDDDAIHYFHNSKIYELMKDALIKYFKYDFAPYTKYNPDFDPFKLNLRKLTLDKKINKLSIDELGEILCDGLYTKNVFDNDSLAQEFCKIIAHKIADRELIKKLLLSLDNSQYNSLKDRERRLSDRIEYLLNI